MYLVSSLPEESLANLKSKIDFSKYDVALKKIANLEKKLSKKKWISKSEKEEDKSIKATRKLIESAFSRDIKDKMTVELESSDTYYYKMCSRLDFKQGLTVAMYAEIRHQGQWELIFLHGLYQTNTIGGIEIPKDIYSPVYWIREYK
jgi:hypothetical protein